MIHFLLWAALQRILQGKDVTVRYLDENRSSRAVCLEGMRTRFRSSRAMRCRTITFESCLSEMFERYKKTIEGATPIANNLGRYQTLVRTINQIPRKNLENFLSRHEKPLNDLASALMMQNHRGFDIVEGQLVQDVKAWMTEWEIAQNTEAELQKNNILSQLPQ